MTYTLAWTVASVSVRSVFSSLKITFSLWVASNLQRGRCDLEHMGAVAAAYLPSRSVLVICMIWSLSSREFSVSIALALSFSYIDVQTCIDQCPAPPP